MASEPLKVPIKIGDWIDVAIRYMKQEDLESMTIEVAIVNDLVSNVRVTPKKRNIVEVNKIAE